MPRTPTDQRLQARASRLRLKPRRNPYFRTIAVGLALGYRRISGKAGTWIARRYKGQGGYEFNQIGTADDYTNPDGVAVLTYLEAFEKSRSWFIQQARRDRMGTGYASSSRNTVADAMDAYLQDYKRRGGKSIKSTKKTIDAHIIPTLGSVLLSRVTRERLEDWLDAIATSRARKRTRKGGDQQYAEFAKDDPEMVRRRRASANRIWSVLRAALNHAYERAMIDSRVAWEAIKPFRETTTSRARFLDDGELKRLINACAPDIRLLVTGAVLTGCRYGELSALRVGDFHVKTEMLHVGLSKSGKPRTVPLSPEGGTFFVEQTAGLPHTAFIFTRDNSKPWGASHQFRPLREACKAAKIIPPASFHNLRHTYASRLVMAGAPLAVVAAVLGHADSRMTERHYAHLQPSYIANVVRNLYAPIGIETDKKVTRLA